MEPPGRPRRAIRREPAQPLCSCGPPRLRALRTLLPVYGLPAPGKISAAPSCENGVTLRLSRPQTGLALSLLCGCAFRLLDDVGRDVELVGAVRCGGFVNVTGEWPGRGFRWAGASVIRAGFLRPLLPVLRVRWG